MRIAVLCGLRVLCAMLVFVVAPVAQAQDIRVGSKQFNEGHILGEIISQVARQTGAEVEHKARMGGTGVVWESLKTGQIDAYVEYTGTAINEIYALQAPANLQELRRLLDADGVSMIEPLGFNNTYAIGMKESLAAKLGIRTISDLAKHPDLKIGFSNEFVERADGWAALQVEYRLPQKDVTGLEHSLAYEALESERIAVTDLYSTDAEIQQYNLRVLEDDRSYFPEYKAVILYRKDLTRRAPDVLKAWRRLQGNVPADVMVGMNAAVKVDKRNEEDVAKEFVEVILPKLEAGEETDGPTRGAIAIDERVNTALDDLPRLTLEHLWLVFVSLSAAVIVAIPFGVIAHRKPRLGQGILGFTGILQTIPSIALLVLLIPLFGIGWWPAVVALFLYSLLPIVRNTHAGLSGIDLSLLESADALGFTPFSRLRLIELPLAGRSILAGIKIAAVINVGTATLGGFIGAGGYGEAIFAGISRQDNVQILSGAIPAALLALLVQLLFEGFERLVVPRGLRLSRE